MANPNPKPIPPEKRGRGRPVGSKDKRTIGIRESIQAMLDGVLAPNLERWVQEIARDKGPEAAIRAAGTFIEYTVPKLGRTELVGKDGGDINVSIKWADE